MVDELNSTIPVGQGVWMSPIDAADGQEEEGKAVVGILVAVR